MEKIKIKKGFILTLDATIALIIVISILLVANIYINKSKSPSLSKLQLNKAGSDVLLQLKYQGVLDTFDISKINYNKSSTLSAGYDMKVDLIQVTGGNPSIVVGNPIPSTSNLGSGRMIFIISNGNIVRGYYTARYYIWPK